MTRLPAMLFVAFFLLLYQQDLFANHLIGGVMTYTCLGNDEYEIEIKVYRDCNCSNCAFFDPELPIGIYRCGTDIGCSSLDQESVFQIAYPVFDSVTFVTNPEYPCLIPPDVCVQQASYTFTVTLPQSIESYYLSYQRCCRNATINNIIAPDQTGATFAIEITPEAQAVCNTSPVFNSFPPTVICAGEPLFYDHSATDSDGDQLVYKFCPPLAGGGISADDMFATTCEGYFPTPGCPPPYQGVTFNGPDYSVWAPMGGDPVVSIDPATGMITGTPNLQGQYVVGVCVEEYRDGVLIGTVFRDFQFNVADCDPLVVADIQEDEEIAPQEFVINSCGETNIPLINQSFDQEYINSWRWDFELNGSMTSFSEWSPIIDFETPGTYFGKLILNADTECGDTAIIQVNIFPEVEADFSFDYDTCTAGPVVFLDQSTTGSCCLTNWNWEFGDGDYTTEQNPSHEFSEPGFYDVRLAVIDTNDCQDILIQTLPYFPVPPLIVLAPDNFTGCQPATIFFNNLSDPIDESYAIRWYFGDGHTSDQVSPSHTYESAGIFSVDVEITSPSGCVVDTTYEELITIESSPVAGFSFSPEETTVSQPEITFSDESIDAASIFWTFGDGHFSSIRNPIHTYNDTGYLAITQTVTHLNGCTDSLIRHVDIQPEVRFFLPNAFTPNNDSVNEYYKGVGMFGGMQNFRFSIWNRWGELVFETTDPNEGWNGRKFNSGRDAPEGVYVVMVNYRGPRGELQEHKGFVTLIR